MKRVTGIGGIFFKAKDAPALQAWYKRHLGIDVQEWGGAAFTWTDGEGKPVAGTTAWSIVPEQSDQFAPSTATFMVNYRVEDLHALVKSYARKAATFSRRLRIPSTGSLPGSSIRKETRSSFGNRRPANDQGNRRGHPARARLPPGLVNSWGSRLPGAHAHPLIYKSRTDQASVACDLNPYPLLLKEKGDDCGAVCP